TSSGSPLRCSVLSESKQVPFAHVLLYLAACVSCHDLVMARAVPRASISEVHSADRPTNKQPRTVWERDGERAAKMEMEITKKRRRTLRRSRRAVQKTSHSYSVG